MGQLSNITQGISRLNMEAKTPQEREAIMWLNSVRSSAYENGLKKELLGSKIYFYGCAKEVARQYSIAEKEIPNIIKDYFGSNTSAMKDITMHICKTYVDAQSKAISRNLTSDSSQKSGKDDVLRTYGTHTMPHIQCVMDKATILIQNRPHLTETEIKTIFVSCLYHDTGMADSRNLGFAKYEEAKEKRESDFFRDKGNTEEKSVSDFIRSNHSLTSGIEILRDRSSLEKLGINVDLCAMVAASHSKSNSGLKDLSVESFVKFVDNMSELVDTHNSKCAPEEYIQFNKEDFLERIKTPEGLDEFRELSKIVSYADAFTHCYDTRDIESTNQLGEKYEIIEIENPPIELMNAEEIKNNGFSSNLFLMCDGVVLPHSDGFKGEGFFIGEHNIICDEKNIDGETVISIDVVQNIECGNTSNCIFERIMETVRFSDVDNKQHIEINVYSQDGNAKDENYQTKLEENINSALSGKLGNDGYEEFSQNVDIKVNLVKGEL